MNCLLMLFRVGLLGAVACHAQKLPAADPSPRETTGARDLAADFRLPPLLDGRDQALRKQFDGLQVGQRARAMGLDLRATMASWRAADDSLDAARKRLAQPRPTSAEAFTGTRVSQLNARIRDPAVRALHVTRAALEADEPLKIGRSALWLDLADVRLVKGSASPTFLLRLEGASHVVVSGGRFTEGDWAVLVVGSKGITLRDAQYEALHGGGIVVTASEDVLVGANRIARVGGAGILLHGASSGVAAVDNDIEDNVGGSNWSAGIVVTDRQAPVAGNPASLLQTNGHWPVEQPMSMRHAGPHRNLIAFNRIVRNASSGIYLDGAVETVMYGNVIEANSKEGVCLDNGATANVLAMNLVRQNGKRWGKTDDELRLEFVEAAGRMADGSAKSKVPGVSIDNAAYNIVYANVVDGNHGGGIKMVRTAFFNLIGLNVVSDNNRGVSDRYHYFGIELGAARADAPSPELDFVPSRGNVVFGNTVRGPHYAGIFFATGSTDNDVFDNSIFQATAWAMEQAHRQSNRSLNNLSNQPSRNIDAGLDARLKQLSSARD